MVALDRAVELAGRGAGTVLPNPVVGCVLLDPTGQVVGEGFHQRAGEPHAEVHALAAAGDRARGATAVVTLEPCNHVGRTGPCSEALLAAGVVRVVVAVRDPFAPAAGGIERLRAGGVTVVDLPAHAALESADDTAAAVAGAIEHAETVNRVWLHAVRTRRPFVTFKAGMTLDGRIAAPDGTSRWITSPEARADVHRLRAQVDTMLVGVGTVLADDPALTVRDADGTPVGRQPLRVVADSTGRTPSTARVRDDAAPTWIAGADEVGDGTRVDLVRLLEELYRRDRRHVLLEGGPTLAAACFDAGLVNEAVLYVAPTVLGAGRPAVDGGRLHTLAERTDGVLRSVRQVGPDVRLDVVFPVLLSRPNS
ncbi:bifunctional diaminohydroxyphosphoribosylaminopyrimidine deaminase/5-amino-6-(5-phosphoribosylamino)uracil reductase RibD [Nakamurella leprariae]|uniref:bifunctional diaminohydroxyphosphoribosylaminopyrimidine deaminase/5-amino-6-(5-phosphoribosylamino)uracil reductase RibD n=1 Tax=Nakamurella leprariae TaxID=2803911 RepID=UPI0038B37F44